MIREPSSVFGSDTENAIKVFQTQSGCPITGKIIDQTLVSAHAVNRCLHVTADFDGGGFQMMLMHSLNFLYVVEEV
jgi:hypothetical protein